MSTSHTQGCRSCFFLHPSPAAVFLWWRPRFLFSFTITCGCLVSSCRKLRTWVPRREHTNTCMTILAKWFKVLKAVFNLKASTWSICYTDWIDTLSPYLVFAVLKLAYTLLARDYWHSGKCCHWDVCWIWGCGVGVSNDMGLIWWLREALICYTDVRGRYGCSIPLFQMNSNYHFPSLDLAETAGHVTDLCSHELGSIWSVPGSIFILLNIQRKCLLS